MKRSVAHLEVSTTKDGEIVIDQNDAGESSGVVISPDQVPILIKWLQEAVAELEKPS